MTATQSIELFDKYGKFVMPSAEQITALDPDTQERFRAVQDAAGDLEKATELRTAAEQGVTDAIAERAESEKDLRRLRPRVDPTQAAKEWIRSQQAER
jgi:hypothetical protein